MTVLSSTRFIDTICSFHQQITMKKYQPHDMLLTLSLNINETTLKRRPPNKRNPLN